MALNKTKQLQKMKKLKNECIVNKQFPFSLHQIKPVGESDKCGIGYERFLSPPIFKHYACVSVCMRGIKISVTADYSCVDRTAISSQPSQLLT